MRIYLIIGAQLVYFLIVIFACQGVSLEKEEIDSLEKDGHQISFDSVTFFKKLDRKIEKFKKEGGLFEFAGEVTLDIGHEYIGRYDISHYAEHSNPAILMGYNNTLHSLEIVDWDHQNIVTSIRLDREGPNGVRNVVGVFYHNQDSIFVLSDFHLLLMNINGEIKLNYAINQTATSKLSGIDFSEQILAPGKGRPIYFYGPQNVLIIPTRHTKHDQWVIPEFYESAVCAKVSLEDRNVELLPLYYPEAYRKQCFGFSNKSFFAYNGKKVVVGFSNSPQLISYDLESEIVSSHDCRSKFYKKMTPFTGHIGDEPAMVAYVNRYTQYMSLYYNPNKQKYYLMSGFKEEDFPGIKFNLSIINEDFITLSELTLSPYFPPIGMISTSAGLAFWDYTKSNNEKSIYQIINLDYEPLKPAHW